MEPTSVTKNNGPRDQTAEKQVEEHPTHSIEWCFGGKPPTSVTCNEAGTVEDVLRRSSQYRKTAEKMKNKERVILMDGKAISSHFPCSLIGNERLTLKYVKAAQSQPGNGSIRPRRKRPSSELVKFHLLTKGGKNVVKILKNTAISTLVQEITVYANKGEKVKQALRRDGRVLSSIFKKNIVLSNISTEVNTEMSNLVDDLDGRTYRIILLDKSCPPESLPGSLDDAYFTQNESQRSDADDESKDLSATTDSVNGNTLKQEQKLQDSTTPGEMVREMPHSNKIQSLLSSQFERSVKVRKGVSRLSRIQNLLRVEFGKSTQTCTEVKTMKMLMDLSRYVCQVRINGSPEGSGFLLFDQFVLTNAHVLKNIYNENRHQLDQRVTVNFSFESLELQSLNEGGQESVAEVEVVEVVGFEYCPDASGCQYDWALLKLGGHQKSPDGLLKRFGFRPPSGGICIIGHPDGGVKKIDSCLIVSPDKAIQVLGGFQYITQRFFDMPDNMKYVMAYNTCFYNGSSGSPVFDKYCNVVAMHTGGHFYKNEKGEQRYIVEFGQRLSFIIEHIIVQMVEKRRFDVLKAYLACTYKHHQDMMINVKKLVESRNNTAFKNVVNSSVTETDESLKVFFEFFCQEEEPVQMEIDRM